MKRTLDTTKKTNQTLINVLEVVSLIIVGYFLILIVMLL